jgi:hypothetical protein
VGQIVNLPRRKRVSEGVELQEVELEVVEENPRATLTNSLETSF